MGQAGAGALAGLGEGMGKMGQTILQATLGNEQLKQNNKWLEANLFRKAAPTILGDMLDAYSAYDQQPTATPAAPSGSPATAPMGDKPVSQVARMLPNEPTQMGSAAILAKRF